MPFCVPRGASAMMILKTSMTIQLKPELEQLIQKDIERGGYESVEQFVERAIQLLHDEEYLLHESKDTIREAIGDGLAQLDRGEGVPGELSRAQRSAEKGNLD
jgi:antitoxin ParD1/3/4